MSTEAYFKSLEEQRAAKIDKLMHELQELIDTRLEGGHYNPNNHITVGVYTLISGALSAGMPFDELIKFVEQGRETYTRDLETINTERTA